ncbi:MAG: hypothetical protein WED34_19140 [Planctomycetales bacterium]
MFTAFACGMFEGERGKDLLARLRSRGTNGFRGAFAECQACWILAGKLKLGVDPSARGRGGKNLDLVVVLNGRVVGVEVKAPLRERSNERIEYGDDSDKIQQAMESANRQFPDDQPNLLVLSPSLRWPLHSNRRDLLKAAFGASKITWTVDLKTGEGGPAESRFFPEGKFLNTERPGGKPLKPDGLPAFRRISAIVVAEEVLREKYPFPKPFALFDEETRDQIWPLWEHQRELHGSDENEIWIDHEVLVLHNPYAYHAISQQTFAMFPQLIPAGDEMRWTDGEKIIV